MADKQQHQQEPQHSRGGVTTKHDRTDVGAPMLPGDPRERVGPEDALGAGAKRGDYTGRLGGSDYSPHTVEPIPPEEQVPGGPVVRVVSQREHAADVADVPRRKGGVETALGPLDAADPDYERQRRQRERGG